MRQHRKIDLALCSLPISISERPEIKQRSPWDQVSVISSPLTDCTEEINCRQIREITKWTSNNGIVLQGSRCSGLRCLKLLTGFLSKKEQCIFNKDAKSLFSLIMWDFLALLSLYGLHAGRLSCALACLQMQTNECLGKHWSSVWTNQNWNGPLVRYSIHCLCVL